MLQGGVLLHLRDGLALYMHVHAVIKMKDLQHHSKYWTSNYHYLKYYQCIINISIAEEACKVVMVMCVAMHLWTSKEQVAECQYILLCCNVNLHCKWLKYGKNIWHVQAVTSNYEHQHSHAKVTLHFVSCLFC